MIGDPSGRSDLRKVMTAETVQHNCDCFKEQMSKFLSFEGENAAIMVNNADWLKDLNYIDFLREIGSVFSVNKMLTAECYKQRLEKGLTFLEFNYMLMQAYDFLVLNRKYGCDPLLIFRRIIAHSAEDVGMANPNALVVATSALTAYEKIGMPEGTLPLAEAIICVCESEKSNSVVIARDEAGALLSTISSLTVGG